MKKGMAEVVWGGGRHSSGCSVAGAAWAQSRFRSYASAGTIEGTPWPDFRTQ